LVVKNGSKIFFKFSGVADLDSYSVLELDLGCLHFKLAALGHGLSGVDEYIGQNLTDLVEVGGNLGETLGKVPLDPDASEDRLVAEKRQRVFDELVDVDLSELWGGRPGEVEKASDRLGDPVNILQHDLDLLAF
jgi:hypothetical protein